MPNSPDMPIHLEGQLLLADPSLHDGFFSKSVVFLTEHSTDNGAYGLILNQPTSQTVGDLLPDKAFEQLKNIRVHIGGPIAQEHLTFAAFSPQKDTPLRLITRISAKDAIKRTQQPGTLVRAFAGYSGWESGQLENELRRNSWITIQPTNELLASEHEKNLWAQILRGLSPYHQILAEAPDDIFVN
jgi:putative transcriptional regulator